MLRAGYGSSTRKYLLREAIILCRFPRFSSRRLVVYFSPLPHLLPRPLALVRYGSPLAIEIRGEERLPRRGRHDPASFIVNRRDLCKFENQRESE